MPQKKSVLSEKRGPSIGYPNVEKLIDTEDFSGVNGAFEKAYKDLEKVSKEKKGLKRGKEAVKAMKSIERSTQLLRELLEVKYRMQEAAKKAKNRP